MMRIRRFQSDDLPAMLEVRRDSILNVAAKHFTLDRAHAWASAQRASNHASQHERFAQSATWVALWDERLAGYSNLRADGYVDTMFVHSEFQGRGLATALLDALENFARSKGMTRLFSDVSVGARPYFEKRGFSVDKNQQVFFADGAVYGFKMEKSL